MNTINNNVTTLATVEAKILADAKPVIRELKSGANSTRPMTKKEFRVKFGLKSGEANRLWAAHSANFDVENKLQLVAAQEAGFRIVKKTFRQGKHSERLTVVLARSSGDAKETLRAQIARLTAENQALKVAVKSA